MTELWPLDDLDVQMAFARARQCCGEHMPPIAVDLGGGVRTTAPGSWCARTRPARPSRASLSLIYFNP